MSISAFEGVVREGKIYLRDNVILPENSKVFVIIPGLEAPPLARIHSPKLVHQERICDFTKDVAEVSIDADL